MLDFKINAKKQKMTILYSLIRPLPPPLYKQCADKCKKSTHTLVTNNFTIRWFFRREKPAFFYPKNPPNHEIIGD